MALFVGCALSRHCSVLRASGISSAGEVCLAWGHTSWGAALFQGLFKGLITWAQWRATLTPELPMDLTVTLGPVLQLQIIPLSKHAPPFLSASLMPWLFLNSHSYLCTLSRYLLPGEPNLWTSFKESFFPVTSKNQFTFETTLIYYAARMKLNLLL